MLAPRISNLCWLVLVGAVWPWSCRAAPAATATDQAAVQQSPTLEALMPGQFTEQYCAALMSGKKIGFVVTSTRRDAGSGCYEVRSHSELSIAKDGRRSKDVTHELRRYSAQPPHALVFIESTAANDGTILARLLLRDEQGWTLKTIEGGQVSTRTLERVEEELESQFRSSRAAIDAEPPFECDVLGFDVDLGRERSTHLRSMGDALQDTSLGPIKARRVQVIVEGDDTPAELCYDSTGRVVGGSLPGFIEFIAMDEASARAPSEALDTDAMSIPVSGLSGAPRRVKKLRLEWRGVTALLPERDFQRVRWLSEGEVQDLVLERVRVPTADELRAPVPAEVAPNLAAEASCESDHPKIRALAAEVADAAADPWAKTCAVVHWVDRELADTFASDRETALGVLETRAGDCTEHALLACALLRAAGVPARRVGGVMFMGGNAAAFGHHAWVEVWIGRWIPVDPTWDQAPADATHVFFGDELSSRFLFTPGMSATAVAVERD